MKVPALCLCLTLALSACSPARPPTRKDAIQLEQDMWRRVGAELAALVPGVEAGKARILLLRAGEKTGLASEHGAIEKALRDQLTQADLVMVALPNQPRTPEQVAALMPDLPTALDPGWLSNEVKKHEPVAAVVSLAGEPVGGPAAGVKWPPLVCYAPSAQTHLKDLIRAGVVRGAVAPNHDVQKVHGGDWYALRFTVVNKENVDRW